jgi:hypothetical protein
VQSKQRLLATREKQPVVNSRVNDKSNLIVNESTRSFDAQHHIINLQTTVGNQAVQRLMSQITNINEIEDVAQRQFDIVSDNNMLNEKVLENSLLSLNILSRRRQKQLDAKILPFINKTPVKTPPIAFHEQVPPPSAEVESIKKGEIGKTDLESSIKTEEEPAAVDTSKETIIEKGDKEKESHVPIHGGSLKKGGAETAVVGRQPAHASSALKQDHAFQMAKKQVNIEAKKQRKLGKFTQKVEAITQKVKETMDASALKEEEQKSQGFKEINIKEMNKVGNEQQKNIQKFDAKGFKEQFKKMVEKNEREPGKIPRTATAVKAYSTDPPIDQSFSNVVSNDISKKQTEMTGPLEQIAILEPDKNVAIKDKKEVPKAFHQAPPKQVEPKLAIPKPKTEQEVSSVKSEGERIQNAMNFNQLSDEQLAESREPSFIQTLKFKDETFKKISESPSVYRQQESTILLDAESVANESLSPQLIHMNKIQRKTGGDIYTSQKHTEEKKTEKRQREIKEKIDGIYEPTVSGVKKDLEALTGEVKDYFAKGLNDNKIKFNENVRKDIKEYYGDWRIDDKVFGPDDVIVNKDDGTTRSLTFREKWGGTNEPTINPDVYKIFLRQKQNFLNAMDVVLDNIANTVQMRLTSALTSINTCKKVIDDFVKTLSGDEQTFANELKKEVETKFESLETSIIDTRDDLLQTLTDEYKETVDQLEVTFNEINDELKKSWIDRAIEFVETVGKTIFEMGKLLLSILTRVADLVTDIIRHPIRFFETLVSGLMQGITNFIDNIGTYLQEAFWTWITGASPVKNIQLSSASGIESLFDLVLQVLNLGPADIRVVVEKIVGKELMEKIDKGMDMGEKALEPIIILIKKGPVSFWYYIKDLLESNIKSTFDRIKESVFNSFIGKALKWIAGFFIPGGGFVKIVKSIVRAFQFVSENLDRIRSFFDSVFDSMNEALQGNTEGVANKIIVGLKTGIVLALDFLAKQIGLDNVIDNVQKIIRSLRKPIVNAIEFVIKKAVKVIKSVGKLFGIGRKGKTGSEKEEDDTEDDEESNAVKLIAAKSLDKKLKDTEDFENIHKAIFEVHKELSPKLKTLELEYSKQDNSYRILASASNKTEVGKVTEIDPDKQNPKTIRELNKLKALGPKEVGGIRKKRKKKKGEEKEEEKGEEKGEDYERVDRKVARVVMKSVVTFEQNTERTVPFSSRVENKRKNLGDFGPCKECTSPLMDLEIVHHDYRELEKGRKPGVAWIENNSDKKQGNNSDELHFVTFNTADPLKEEVVSHAETGFLRNLKNHLKKNETEKIKNVRINISHSPCSGCVNKNLKDFVTTFKDHLDADTKLQIAWERGFKKEIGKDVGNKPIHGPGTTLKDVADLINGGWQIPAYSIQLISDMVKELEGQQKAAKRETQKEAEELKKLKVSISSVLSNKKPSTIAKSIEQPIIRKPK